EPRRALRARDRLDDGGGARERFGRADIDEGAAAQIGPNRSRRQTAQKILLERGAVSRADQIERSAGEDIEAGIDQAAAVARRILLREAKHEAALVEIHSAEARGVLDLGADHRDDAAGLVMSCDERVEIRVDERVAVDDQDGPGAEARARKADGPGGAERPRLYRRHHL